MRPTVTYNNRMREARHAARLSQRALAERAGLSGPFISLIEIGKRGQRAWARRRIARALGMPETYLFPDAEPGHDYNYGRAWEGPPVTTTENESVTTEAAAAA